MILPTSLLLPNILLFLKSSKYFPIFSASQTTAHYICFGLLVNEREYIPGGMISHSIIAVLIATFCTWLTWAHQCTLSFVGSSGVARTYGACLLVSLSPCSWKGVSPYIATVSVAGSDFSSMCFLLITCMLGKINVLRVLAHTNKDRKQHHSNLNWNLVRNTVTKICW